MVSTTSNLTLETIIEPEQGWLALDLRAVWEYRELLYFLMLRELQVRYKQTALGVAWVILQPVVNVLIFTFLFGGILKVSSGGVPYPIFAFTGLLPWTYFTESLTRASTGLVRDAGMISKVYFPRMVVPMASVLSGLVDFVVSLVLLCGLMVYYRISLTAAALLLPVFLLLAVLTSLGVSLWLSALNVRYRDVNNMIPFLVRTWMYLTPVIYPSTLIPSQFRFLLSLNPMTGVVEGFRWALLGPHLAEAQPPGTLFAISIGLVFVVLLSGLVYFRRTESTFADII